MNKCEGHIALDKDTAIENLLKKCTLEPKYEIVSLEDALMRISADDVLSRHTLPNMPSSRMDGIAVSYDLFKDGEPDTSEWREGREYVFCNCGIGIPDGYDTAIRIEDVDIDENGHIHINAFPSSRGHWITPPGTNIKKGELIVRKGDALTPYLISRLAAGGYGSVRVVKKPVVAFIPTGSELVPAGQPVPSGKNTETNSLMMRGKIQLWGGEPIIYPINRDDPETIRSTLNDALERADIVVINAGSSQGREDFTVEVLESFGTILSHMLKSGPGAHTSCTVAHSGKPIVGIPGPAVGAESVADWFIKPLIDTYLGIYAPPRRVKAIYSGNDIAPVPPSMSARGMSRMTSVILTRDQNGKLYARPAEPRSSIEINESNAFLEVTSAGVRSGSEIEVELRYPYRFI